MNTILFLAIVITQLRPSFHPDVFWYPETCLAPENNKTSFWQGASCSKNLVPTPDGELHLVYYSWRPNPQRYQIYYKRCIPYLGWRNDTCISGDLVNTERVYEPAIACDSQGNLHIVWNQYMGYNIWYKTRRADGVWDSVSTQIGVGSVTQPREAPNVACTPDGHIHVVWQEWYPLYGAWIVYREKVGNEWGPTFHIDSVDSGKYISFPDIACGPDNSVYVLYNKGERPASPMRNYCRIRQGGVWGQPELIILNPEFTYSASGHIAVSPVTGEPHVCLLNWNHRVADSTIIYHTWRSGGVWLAPDTLFRAVEPLYIGVASFTITPDGFGHLLWWFCYAPSYNPWLQHSEQIGEREWTPGETLWIPPADTIRAYNADICSGGGAHSNNLYLIWDVFPGVYFKYGVVVPSEIHGEKAPAGKPLESRLFLKGRDILYSVSQAGFVRLSLFDVAGRMLKKLDAGERKPGTYTSSIPEGVPAGVYFVRLDTTVDGGSTAKAVILK